MTRIGSYELLLNYFREQVIGPDGLRILFSRQYIMIYKNFSMPIQNPRRGIEQYCRLYQRLPLIKLTLTDPSEIWGRSIKPRNVGNGLLDPINRKRYYMKELRDTFNTSTYIYTVECYKVQEIGACIPCKEHLFVSNARKVAGLVKNARKEYPR